MKQSLVVALLLIGLAAFTLLVEWRFPSIRKHEEVRMEHLMQDAGPAREWGGGLP